MSRLSILIIIMVIMLCGVPLCNSALAASSPSFFRQEIPPSNKNFFDVFRNRPTPNGEKYIDIQSVSYSSDGRYLNATIWLSNFTFSPTDYESINYGMYFDVDSNNSTGLRGIDYNVELGWNNESKTWLESFEEWSSSGRKKTLSQIPSQDFTENGGSYVTLSADLEAMFSPSSYKVLFYSEIYNPNQFDWIVDATNWVYIPPPRVELSLLPSPPIVLVQGESSTVEVRVNSSTADEIILDLYPLQRKDNSNNSSVSTEFSSLGGYETLQVAPHSITSTHMQISAAPDAEPTIYTMTLRANMTPISEPLFIQPRFAESATEEDNDNSSSNSADSIDDSALVRLLEENFVTDETLMKQSTFSVEVQEWALDKQLNEFVNQWLTPLTAIYTTISAIISGILGWIYGRKQQQKKSSSNNEKSNNNNDKNNDNVNRSQ